MRKCRIAKLTRDRRPTRMPTSSIISAILRPDDAEMGSIIGTCQDLAERGLTNPLLRLRELLGCVALLPR